MKEKKKLLIISIITLLIMLVNIILLFNKIVVPKMKIAELEKEFAGTALPSAKAAGKDMTEYEWVKLQLASENNRMKTYVAKFFKYVMQKEYDSAYSLLYEDFKKNYFPTLEDFENYAKDKYSMSMSVTYESIEIQGVHHIIFLTVADHMDIHDDFKQTFIIVENSFDDIVMSFSV